MFWQRSTRARIIPIVLLILVIQVTSIVIMHNTLVAGAVTRNSTDCWPRLVEIGLTYLHQAQNVSLVTVNSA